MSRRRQFNILLSEEERSKLDHLAAERGLTVSDWVRQAIKREAELSQNLSPLEIDAAYGRMIREKLGAK